jgi:hypothetical protein
MEAIAKARAARLGDQKAIEASVSADAQYIARRIVGNLWGIWWVTLAVGLLIAFGGTFVHFIGV